jgi:hypothetical protein
MGMQSRITLETDMQMNLHRIETISFTTRDYPENAGSHAFRVVDIKIVDEDGKSYAVTCYGEPDKIKMEKPE